MCKVQFSIPSFLGAALKISGFVCIYAKHFDLPSEYGIEGGRISKLGIRKGREVVLNYDRGWVIEPETEGAQLALLAICQKLN